MSVWETILPFVANQGVTAGDWNSIFDDIRSGIFFTGDTGLTGSLATLGDRVTAAETRLDTLEGLNARNTKKDQFMLIADQHAVTLTSVPTLDSEQVALAGVLLPKSNVPSGFTGGLYTVSGSGVTLDASIGVTGGEILSVTYQYEVF